MKKRKLGKVILRVFAVLIAALMLLTLVTYAIHRVKSGRELERLKEAGYYNPVSVGDYSLNVAKFGNENGKHRIVVMAGLLSGEHPVAMRQVTKPFEEDDLVVFADRAGYGLSDDTDNEMTLEYIVEDYRRALQSAGVEAPYILMPHSIGGVYATYWVSKYPEEIEAVVFLDGTQLSENAYDDDTPDRDVGISDKALAMLAKMGYGRYALRKYFDLLPDNYTDEEQYLADALCLRMMSSIAPVSESGRRARNGRKAFAGIAANDVPKLYICSSWGFETKEDMEEYIEWTNRQIEKNHMKRDKADPELDDEAMKKLLGEFEDLRQEVVYPYAEKMGNCRVVCLGGDHMIFEQKPQECVEMISEFLKELDEERGSLE